MANASSSPSQILCASFNQDNSFFSIGTKEGFKIFEARTGRLCYENSLGAYSIVEMLFSSSLLAIVGAGEQPSLSPRRLSLFNKVTGAASKELNFLTSIMAVRVNRKRLIVVLQDKTYIYDLNSTAILDVIDTVPNTKGLCAFAPNSEGCYLALPASTTRGSVLVYNALELQSLCQIDAHRSPLAAISFSSTGTYLATASEKGTIVRVHLVSQATKFSKRYIPVNNLFLSICTISGSSGYSSCNQLLRLLAYLSPGAFAESLIRELDSYLQMSRHSSFHRHDFLLKETEHYQHILVSLFEEHSYI